MRSSAGAELTRRLIIALLLLSACTTESPPAYMPKEDTNNIWHHPTDSETTIVFVHGILSDSRSCWYNSEAKTYWPEMVKGDKERFGDVSIYLAGYYTEIDSGAYDVRSAASEVIDGLTRVRPGEPRVIDKKNIVFVCHSTGGIVARYLLEDDYELFAGKNVGLVLIASPSYGSRQADRLSWLVEFYENELGKQLQWGNWTLRDLDARFRKLLNEKRIPSLKGIEAYENHFVIHHKWWPDTKYVVTEESAGRYFGPAKPLRKTDHFTAVKPDSDGHPAYELLADFYQNEFSKLAEHARAHSNATSEGQGAQTGGPNDQEDSADEVMQKGGLQRNSAPGPEATEVPSTSSEGQPNQLVETGRLVMILDSKSREKTLGQLQSALAPLELDGLITIEPSLITDDLDVAYYLAKKRPSLVIAHVHAFAPQTESSEEAWNKLLDLFEALSDGNEDVKFLVYSGGFVGEPTEGRAWLSRMVESRTMRGGQVDGYYPPFLDRVDTIGLRSESEWPAAVVTGLRRRVRHLLEDKEARSRE